MSGGQLTVRDVLYEAPGPRTRRIVNIVTAISVLILIWLIAVIVRRFYESGQLEARLWSFFLKGTTWKFLGKGLLGTLEASAVSAVVSFITGFVMMLGRISKRRIPRMIATAIIEFTRGVPTLLFIYFFFLVIPQYGIKMSALLKIALPVAISASGVVAEAFRSGVNAVPKGQSEAAFSLGMTDAQTFIKVVFPQAFRFVIPALIAELVIVVKDTTFAYVVSFPDLMQNAKVLISNYDSMLPVYLLVAVVYIIINYVLNKISASFAQRNRKSRLQEIRETGDESPEAA